MKWQAILTHASALLLAGFLTACDRNAYIGNPAPSPQLPGDVDLGHGYVRRDGAVHFLSGGTTGDGADATRALDREEVRRPLESMEERREREARESPALRGLANMLAEAMKEGSADIDIYGADYRTLVEEQMAERIGNELSNLQHILNETQLTRYREHLEAEPAW